jgi:hypothetical protein
MNLINFSKYFSILRYSFNKYTLRKNFSYINKKKENLSNYEGIMSREEEEELLNEVGHMER